ncbi:MAG: prepilin-type N-terminal cleavage/methylation domain-containing protein [bacterium]|nr:prepilin-type N-terminal cleavage/methylation domain-containing protein [bacterium]
MMKGQKGFTLVEIMIALAILAVGLLALYTAQGNSLRASGNAERIQVASMLAREKMTERMMEINKDMAKGSFPDDKTEETGEFDPPFEDYRWEYNVRKVEIPIAGGEGGEGEGAQGGEGSQGNQANQAPASAQKNMAQIVSKKIAESVREISIRILWEELGEEQSVKVTTHVSRL